MKRTERQGHGFEYEQNVVQRFGLQKSTNYISPFDSMCGDIPVQIKCIKFGCAIELGDYFRNKQKNCNFILIIGFWKDSKDNIIEEYIFFVKFDVFIANLHYDADEQMIAELKLISNLYEDDDCWEAYCNRHKSRFATFHNKIDIRFKRDHKTQKRIQCAISWNNFNTWFKPTFECISVRKFEDILSKYKLDKTLSMMSQETPYIQNIGLTRNTLDQYYTKKDIAKQYIDVFMEIINPSSERCVLVEPSAGNGAFSDILRDTSLLTLAYDIDPKKDYMVQHDFLDTDVNIFKHDDVNVHCIGNPPFGKQNSLVKKFIQHCSKFSTTIAFILPRSFKKASCYNAFPLLFHKVYEEDCPINGFEVNNKEHKVPCVFQIWVKKDVPREQVHIIQPNGYVFTDKSRQPDFAIRRVGGTAGKADKVIDDKNTQSHLFVKLSPSISHMVDEIIEKMNAVKYDFNNTVGPKSISKPEFIEMLNNAISKQ